MIIFVFISNAGFETHFLLINNLQMFSIYSHRIASIYLLLLVFVSVKYSHCNAFCYRFSKCTFPHQLLPSLSHSISPRSLILTFSIHLKEKIIEREKRTRSNDKKHKKFASVLIYLCFVFAFTGIRIALCLIRFHLYVCELLF